MHPKLPAEHLSLDNSMIVKLDEDLSPMVAEPLRAAGYQVRTVADQGWSGLADDELWRHVVAQNEFLVTADKGFADLRSYPPGTHPGILLLRPERESLVEFCAVVSVVLAAGGLESLTGCVSVASPRGLRIRRHS